MKYEWDSDKAAANLKNHGVSFEAARGFEWDTALISEDARRNYGETRYRALGLVSDRLHTFIFTTRADAIRIISLRKSNRRGGESL